MSTENKLDVIVISILAKSLAYFIAAIPGKLLWNWLMPTIFNLPRLELIQVFGLIWLFYIIFPFNSPSITSSIDYVKDRESKKENVEEQ